MIRKTVIILTTAAAMAVPVIASASHSEGEYQYAKVVDVENLYRYETVQIPHRECYTTTAHREVRRDDYRHDRGRRYSGSGFSTVAGGVIGGVIGHQFGKGNGRDAMTIAGTLIGAAVGHNASHRREQVRPSYTVVRSYPVERCETRYTTEERRVADGYQVTYRFAGREYSTQTYEHPGKEIRVRVAVTPVEA